MGSKNRINLGLIMEFILHCHRNFYYKTKIYMSKRVQMKIKVKHNDVKIYTELYTFQSLMHHTIAFYPYNKCKDTMNFIANIDNKFVLYSLKREKQHTTCNTIYTVNTKALKKLYKQKNFTLLKPSYIKIIEEAITD